MKLEDLEAKLGIANMGEEDKLALVKDIQANIPALKAEQRVLEAKTQANLVVEAIKKIKESLEARFDELNGIVDVKVRDITSGKDGIDGKDGKNGKDGRDGKDGISITGPKGADGEAGQDGVGVQDAHIDFDGSLIITLTDGRELNVGEVVPMDVAEKIKIIGNGGGTSQSVLDSLTSLQNQINTLTGIDGTLGTMAQQDDTSVDINGGAIDNTTVGSTTPAAGTFTTLTATGESLLGLNGSNNQTFRAIAGTGAFPWTQTSHASGDARIRASAASGNSNFSLSSLGTSAVRFYTNAFTDLQFQVSNTASAVNSVQVTGSPTGVTAATLPSLSVQGSDSTTYLGIGVKGTGYISFHSGTTNNQVFRINTANAATNANRIEVNAAPSNSSPSISVAGGTGTADTNIDLTLTPKGTGGINAGNNFANFLDLSGAATGFGAFIASQGSDTNIPLVLQPKGTGALQAQQTDSTATGGNARGANAVDWQTSRSTAAQVANGSASVIGGGDRNTASGFNAVVSGGFTGTASNTYTFIGGGVINSATGYGSSVVGGYTNTAAGFFNFIGNGFSNSGTSNSAVTTQSATMNGTTAVTLSGSNANIKVGQLITGTSINTFPNTYVAAVSGTSLTLSQAASGSSTSTLSFFTPHGVVVGGGNNQATGSYSFIGGGGDAGTAGNRNVASGDWSTVAGGFKNTASGNGSFIGGGGTIGSFTSGNSASGGASFVGSGLGNTASNTSSVVVGGFSNTANSTAGGILNGYWGTTRSIAGMSVFPSHNAPIASSAGVTQASLLMLGVQTTDATATVLRSDTNAASTTNQVILPNNSAYYFKGTVVAGVTGGGNTKGWTVEGVIKRGANAASTAIVGTATVLSSYADAGAATWAITATADTTNGGLAITFTGQAATTIRCVAKIETTEMTY